MKVLVDTCVWSLALRRTRENAGNEVLELQSLIRNHAVEIIGPVRQELLSGVRDKSQFEQLRAQLATFIDIPLVSGDYILAAEYYNFCRAKGVQGSNTDFLICAVSTSHELTILTTDKDFQLIAQHLPIRIYRSSV